MEIICISCWRAFEHDASTAAAEVTCPECGFAQPGPDPSSLDAKLDANTRPSATTTAPPQPTPASPAPEAAAATTPDLTPPSPTFAETADFGSPPDPAPAPARTPQPATAPPPAPAEEVAKPDHRWRLRTRALLVLFFPDYEALSRFLTGDEGVGYAVACGPGPFRTLTGFSAAMRVTDDPLEALVNVPPAEGDEGEAAPAPLPRPRTARRASSPSAQTRIEPPSQNAGGAREETASARARTRRRRTSASADFTFRKAQAQNVWPGRLLFLLVGLLVGSAAIYYVAWIGLLPGIVY